MFVSRLYTQLDTSKTGDLAKGRQASSKSFQESGGRVDINGVTAEEVLEQANKIFAPYTLKFAAPLSWFAVWKSKFMLVQRKEKRRKPKKVTKSSQSASESQDHFRPKTIEYI